MKAPPQGLLGGGDGKRCRVLVNERPIDPAEHWVLRNGDRIVMETAGGGGFGKPSPTLP